jgi:hypothetical protein
MGWDLEKRFFLRLTIRSYSNEILVEPVANSTVYSILPSYAVSIVVV